MILEIFLIFKKFFGGLLKCSHDLFQSSSISALQTLISDHIECRQGNSSESEKQENGY